MIHIKHLRAGEFCQANPFRTAWKLLGADRLIIGVLLVVIVGNQSLSRADSTQLALPPVSGKITAETAEAWGVLEYQGRYRVINNVWNKGAATASYKQTVFLETIDGKSGLGWRWNWPDGRTVVAYPEVVCGDKPWDPPSPIKNQFPFQVRSKRVAADFDLTINATGVYNLAFTLWLISDPANPRGSITHEIMIWTANHGGTPAGIKRAAAYIHGASFDLYVNPNQTDNSGANRNTWTYIALAAQRPLLKGSLDIRACLDHLLETGLISTNSFVASLELGTEVSGGIGSVEVRDYSINIR